MPVRVQLSRKKGWRMPANTVKVSRPTKWGNPFTVEAIREKYGCNGFEAARRAVIVYRAWLMGTNERYLKLYIEQLGGPRCPGLSLFLDQLRGKNLACWCKPGEPCHADVLLELANR